MNDEDKAVHQALQKRRLLKEEDLDWAEHIVALPQNDPSNLTRETLVLLLASARDSGRSQLIELELELAKTARSRDTWRQRYGSVKQQLQSVRKALR